VYRVVYTKQAAKDIKNLKAAGLSIKAKELIEIIKEDSFRNPPSYEGLVGNLDGFYSRRINIKHRLVYQVYGDELKIDDTEYEGTIKIVRMWTHYDM
jgi:Txe/YoeB family toxin of toxin-antitoxin system